MEAKDILSIYISDNALINQKNAYYFAANALLVVPVANIYAQDPNTAAMLCCVGVLFSIISLVSIARTAAFRQKSRRLLEAKDEEYKELYSDREFRWWAKVPSNPVLIGPPAVGLCMWLWAVSRLLRWT